MNTELLKEVAETILNNPAKYNQENYCGTSCCIAGHAMLIAKPDLEIDGIKVQNITEHNFNDMAWQKQQEFLNEAQKLLDINDSQWENLCNTFGDNWPFPFREKLQAAKTKKCRAKVAYERIMHFIETGD
jgi:hypothetical protein